MPRSLTGRLRRRIADEGPLTFAAFMEAALYDPEDGFYMRHSVGEKGEFLTSPHVSAAFGALVARQVEEFWALLDRPDRFSVIEAGAGDGTLARQILQSLDPQMLASLSYWAVERSPAAREALAGPGIDVASSLDEVPSGRVGCVLANELLDNLPFHRLLGREAGLKELFVGVEGEGFGLIEAAVSSAEIAHLAPELALGEEAVVSPAALAFMDRAASQLNKGYLLLIDYGWPSGRPDASVHGYRAHRLEADVLDDPGSRDVTAGVDFGALARHARDREWQVWGPVTQRDALLTLGYRDIEARGRAEQVDAIADRRGADALHIYDQRNRASLLVRKGGLGDFLVLFVGVGDVPAPIGGSAVDVSDHEEDAAQDGDQIGHQGPR